MMLSNTVTIADMERVRDIIINACQKRFFDLQGGELSCYENECNTSSISESLTSLLYACVA